MKYIVFPLAAVLLVLGLVLCGRAFRCRRAVQAKFVKLHVMKGMGMKDYFPVFRYEYEGAEYEAPCMQSFSKKELDKKFKSGHKYTVYIQPDNPRRFTVLRRPQAADFLVVLLGIACFIWYFAIR